MNDCETVGECVLSSVDGEEELEIDMTVQQKNFSVPLLSSNETENTILSMLLYDRADRRREFKSV